MSFLTCLSRTGSSQAKYLLLQKSVPSYASRTYSTRNTKKRGKNWVQVNDRGEVVKKNLDNLLSPLRSLPEDQLDSPVFESTTSHSLKLLPEFKADAITENLAGKATVFSLARSDPFKKFGLPKNVYLEHRILSKPCTVIRNVTLDLLNTLQNAKNHSSDSSRYILTGRSGVGKSCLLVQAVQYCIQSGWIVIYIPRGVSLVNSTTPYTYDLRTRTYLQPTSAYQILQRMYSVNESLISSLSTSKKLVFEKREVPLGTSLSDLMSVASKDISSSPSILDAVLTELSHQTKHPVLLAVDDFQAFYGQTAYRDPFFSRIRPYHLSMPRLILEFAAGKRSFAKGAMIGAITYSDPAYPLPLELRDALGMSYGHPTSPYDNRSETVISYTSGLKSLPLPEKFTVDEASALFEVWMDEQVLVPSVYDELFLSKYTESSGNPRQFVKGLLSTHGV